HPAWHLLLDQELPDRGGGRRPARAAPRVRLLRPDPHPARRGPAVVGGQGARPGRQRPGLARGRPHPGRTVSSAAATASTDATGTSAAAISGRMAAVANAIA